MPTVQLRHALDLHLLKEMPYVSRWSILVLLTEVGGRNLLRYQASGMEPYFSCQQPDLLPKSFLQFTPKT